MAISPLSPELPTVIPRNTPTVVYKMTGRAKCLPVSALFVQNSALLSEKSGIPFRGFPLSRSQKTRYFLRRQPEWSLNKWFLHTGQPFYPRRKRSTFAFAAISFAVFELRASMNFSSRTVRFPSGTPLGANTVYHAGRTTSYPFLHSGRVRKGRDFPRAHSDDELCRPLTVEGYARCSHVTFFPRT